MSVNEEAIRELRKLIDTYQSEEKHLVFRGLKFRYRIAQIAMLVSNRDDIRAKLLDLGGDYLEEIMIDIEDMRNELSNIVTMLEENKPAHDTIANVTALYKLYKLHRQYLEDWASVDGPTFRDQTRYIADFIVYQEEARTRLIKLGNDLCENWIHTDGKMIAAEIDKIIDLLR